MLIVIAMKWKNKLIALKQKLNAKCYPVHRALNRRKPLKVKLVAVAKNEAAYIPEWVYHHLYFGFDAIEIFYNGCTDNTADLQALLPTDKVRLICADRDFENNIKSPQIIIYRKALKAAHRQGFTHVMFLDLDEFWLPLDFSTSIKAMVEDTPQFDLMSFPWRNKVEETLFERPVVKETVVETAQQIKTLFSSYLRPVAMNPHNTIDRGLTRLHESGKEFPVFDKVFAQVPKNLAPERALVVHRKFRSEKEYVAMLSRGRPINAGRVRSQFKDNRSGYTDRRQRETIHAPEAAFEKYSTWMDSKLTEPALAEAIEHARNLVLQRYQQVLKDIASAPQSEAETIEKILRRVQLPDVLKAHEVFKARHQSA